MTKRPREHIIEDLARAQLRYTFANAGWLSENLDQDYGEDIFVRFFENESATPWSFYVQSKATDHIERYLSKDRKNLSFPLKSPHLEHWDSFWEPVVLTIYDVKTKIIYWEIIQKYLSSASDSKLNRIRNSVSVKVPINNQLNDTGLMRIKKYTKKRFQRFETYKKGAEILIDELREQLGLNIDYEPESGLLILPKGKFHADSTDEYSLTVTFFGKSAARVDHLSNKYGIAPQKVMKVYHDFLFQVLRDIQPDGTILIRDYSGKVIDTWKTLEEMVRYVKLQEEFDDY